VLRGLSVFCPRASLLRPKIPGCTRTVTDEERKIVTEKGARRFDRFEQWLMRHLVDPESLYNRLQGRIMPTNEDFEKIPD
jgi:hypothetical protein